MEDDKKTTLSWPLRRWVVELEGICIYLRNMKICVTAIRPSGSATRLLNHLADKPM
jgi:hypothetical protein